MKIYKDYDLKNEVDLLDLGIVQAGNTKQFEFWLYNDLRAYLKELQFKIEHAEVIVVEAPKEMKSHAKAKLVLSWTPSITLKEGLKARLCIMGLEIYGN
jgi:hypothetical protein